MTMRLYFAAGPWRRLILASIPAGALVGCSTQSDSNQGYVVGGDRGALAGGSGGTAGASGYAGDAGAVAAGECAAGADVGGADSGPDDLGDAASGDASLSDTVIGGIPTDCRNPVQLGGNWILCQDGFLFRTEPGECEPDLAPIVMCERPEECSGVTLTSMGGAPATREATSCRPFNASGGSAGYCAPSAGCNTDAECRTDEVCLCGQRTTPAAGEASPGPLAPSAFGNCIHGTCNTSFPPCVDGQTAGCSMRFAQCDEGEVCATDDTGAPAVCPSQFVMEFAGMAPPSCRSLDRSCAVQADCERWLVCTASCEGPARCVAPTVPLGGCPTGGRPFFVAGKPQVAPLTTRSDWQMGNIVVAKDGLSQTECTLLGQAWAQVAAMEHASIASFARFVLQLMAAGAPASLVEQSQRALGDEVVHARACYGLASAYLGHAVGPDRLLLGGATLDESFEQSVIAAVREGCIGETLAAIEAAELAAHCEEPTTREILRQIAEDEARHAQLAWQFVSWALSNGGMELRSLVQQEFERAVNAFELPNAASTTNDEWFASRGIMAPSSRRALQARAMTDVIAPCAAEVLSETRSLAPRRGGACPARSGAGV